MKLLFIFFLFLTAPLIAYELRSLHFEKDERLSKGPQKKAIGLMVLQISNTARITSTGFFYAPNLFLTARDPEQKDLPNCSKISIYNEVELTGDAEIKAEETFKCKNIRLSNPRFGFMVIETKENNKNYIPLPNAEQIQDWKTSKIFALGYSRRSEFLLSKDCKPEPGNCKICKVPKGVEIYLPSWGEASCLSKKGMSGSPLFFINSQNQWVPIGFIGKYTGSNDPSFEVAEKISLLRLESLQKQFGKSLIGDFEKNE